MKDLERQIEQLKEQIETGQTDPLQVYLQLKQKQDFYKQLLDSIDEYVQKVIQTYATAKEIEMFGIKFKVNVGRKTFDFKHIPSWNTKKIELEGIEKLLKANYESYEKGLLPDVSKQDLPTVSYSKRSITISKK